MLALAAAMGGGTAASGPVPSWLTEEQARAEIIGKELAGHYLSGRPWKESYGASGLIDYSDSQDIWSGEWSFRGPVFCTFYNDGVDGGCWLVRKANSNCYEFHRVGPDANEQTIEPLDHSWYARGSRTELPSTCEAWTGV